MSSTDDTTAALIDPASVPQPAPPRKTSFFGRLKNVLLVMLLLLVIGLALAFFLSDGSIGDFLQPSPRKAYASGRYIRVQRSRGSPGKVSVTEIEVVDHRGRKIWLRHNVDGVNATATPSLISTTEFHTPNFIYDGNTRARLPQLTNLDGDDIMNENGKKMRFALTGSSPEAQVQIDMGATRKISKVIVYNNDLEQFRGDIVGCEVVLSGADGEIAFRSPPIAAVQNRYEFHVASAVQPVAAPGIVAKIVRLQLKRRELLHVNEIQVIGPDGQVYNDATATSSSVSMVNRKVVDGESGEETNVPTPNVPMHGPQHINNGFLWRTIPGGTTVAGGSTWAMFQSTSENGPSVQLELDTAREISKVVIYNRNWDGVDRIAPAHIMLFNAAPEAGGEPLFTHDIVTNEYRYDIDVVTPTAAAADAQTPAPAPVPSPAPDADAI